MWQGISILCNTPSSVVPHQHHAIVFIEMLKQMPKFYSKSQNAKNPVGWWSKFFVTVDTIKVGQKLVKENLVIENLDSVKPVRTTWNDSKDLHLMCNLFLTLSVLLVLGTNFHTRGFPSVHLRRLAAEVSQLGFVLRDSSAFYLNAPCLVFCPIILFFLFRFSKYFKIVIILLPYICVHWKCHYRHVFHMKRLEGCFPR